MPVDALPGREEAREAPLIGGLDLLAQSGERGAPQPPQNLDVAPLALGSAGTQLASNQLAVSFELPQHRTRVDAIAHKELVGSKGPMGPSEPRDQLPQRARHVGEKRLGQPAGRHDAERVAVEPGLVGGDEALLAADAHPNSAPFALELAQQPIGIHAGEDTVGNLHPTQVPDATQHVVQAIAPGCTRHLRAMLQVVFDARERAGVDQLAQLLLSEQLAQQIAVERQRGGAPLGAGRVALVHVGGDVVEQQRGGKRRGGLGLDLDERDLAGGEAAQQLL